MKIRHLTALGGAVLFLLGLALALIDSFVFQTSLSLLSIVACVLGAILAGGGLYVEVLRLASAIAEGLLNPFARIPKDATSITVRQAKALMKQNGDCFSDATGFADVVSGFTSLDERNRLLNGLTNLSDEAASVLAQSEGDLCLDGLATLSDQAGKAL